MYSLSDESKALYLNCNKQFVEITLHASNGDVTITDADIVQGTFGISRMSASGNRLELGTCIASDLQFSLSNTDGRYNDLQFGGAEMYVVQKTRDMSVPGSAMVPIPQGYFTIDNAPARRSIIKITALDRMARFARYVDWDVFPTDPTVEDIVRHCCARADVPLAPVSISARPNATRRVEYNGKADVTYRDLLGWCCELLAACAYIDWDGQLRISWYEGESAFEITPEMRYMHELADSQVSITGIKAEVEDELYQVGSDDYGFDITGNPFLTAANTTAALEAIYGVIGQTTYTPVDVDVRPMPWLYPLDVGTFVKNGTTYNVIVSRVVLQLGAKTALTGVGETEQEAGYATANTMSRKEQAIIDKIAKKAESDLNANSEIMLHANELLANALGLFFTRVEQDDGSVITYAHSASTLETSDLIYTFSAGGFAWTTTGWNGGSPVWQEGMIPAAGLAFFNHLATHGITVTDGQNPFTIEVTPSNFKIRYGDMDVATIEGREADKSYAEMRIPKTVISDYLEIGRIRIAPYRDSTGALTGTNIIFVDREDLS